MRSAKQQKVHEDNPFLITVSADGKRLFSATHSDKRNEWENKSDNLMKNIEITANQSVVGVDIVSVMMDFITNLRFNFP